MGISPDSPESHRKFIDKNRLKITLLSDSSRGILEKYGAWGEKKLYGKKSLGVIRSTFLVDPEGILRHAWSGVKVAGHAGKVKEKLAELLQK